MKLRSDMLFLIMAEGLTKRFVVLTEASMHATCLKERAGGRTPNEIDFLLAEIPDELQRRLVQARSVASKEVTPKAIEEELPDEVLLGTTSGESNER